MASSTRRVMQELFGMSLPLDQSKEKISRQILAYENFDKEYISGATDAFGLVYPNINKFNFNNSYYPHSVESLSDELTIQWLEERIFLVHLGVREADYKVFQGSEKFKKTILQEYCNLAEMTWRAINERNIQNLIIAVKRTCELQHFMIPGYIDAS